AVRGNLSQKPLNKRFIWLMERRAQKISPADLRNVASAWNPCHRCKSAGVVGSPLKRTLEYCGCDIGQQEHADRGDDCIREEIGRVHASFKSKLVQSCRELRLDFTGDSVEREETNVIEHDRVVEIRPAVGWQICCNERDLNKALEYLGDRRPAHVVATTQLTQEAERSTTKATTQDAKRITQNDVDRVMAERRQQAPARKEPSQAEALDAQSRVAAVGLQ